LDRAALADRLIRDFPWCSREQAIQVLKAADDESEFLIQLAAVIKAGNATGLQSELLGLLGTAREARESVAVVVYSKGIAGERYVTAEDDDGRNNISEKEVTAQSRDKVPSNYDPYRKKDDRTNNLTTWGQSQNDD
jgi:hypothetical protein